LEATESVCKELEKDNFLSDYHYIGGLRYVSGHFSGLPRKECFVICPMRRETGSANPEQDFVMLFYETKQGQWEKGNFTELTQEVKFIDIDNDSLPELICHGEWVWRGFGERTDIYSVKGDKKKLLYSNYVHNDDMISGFEIGDTIWTEYEISFIDVNKDGIMEIKEDKTVEILLETKEGGNPEDDDVKKETKSSTKILYLKNGTYY
jgi:hypothetical protein